ncbi:MAG TPA: hypothetical protein VN783_15905 [Thermoanaerobaculia bacterium]|nr:hypothetical protein [Thermoanaerobaculia bacterium]
MQTLRRFSFGLAAALAYALLASFYLRPIWRVFTNHLAPGPGDPILNLYFLEWGMHQIGLGLPDLWNANFFHPLRGALTLSDHLLGPAFQLFLLRPLVPNPIAGYNLLLFTSFVGSGLATAWVLRQSGCSRPAALLAGGLFAFCPYRWSQLPHLQVLLMQWIPVTLWSFDRLLAERSAKRAAVFLAFYLLHVTGGCYFAYMIHVPMAALLAVRWLREGRELASRRSLRILAPVAVVCVLALAALFLPYVRFSREHDLARNPGDVVAFGATFASYLSPAPGAAYFDRHSKNLLYGWAPGLLATLTRAENALFPGLLALGFGLFGLRGFYRRGGAESAAGSGRPGRGEKTATAVVVALLLLALASLAAGDGLTLRGMGPGPRPPEWVWWLSASVASSALAGAWLVRRRAGRPPLLLASAESEPWWTGLGLGAGACLLLSLPVFYVPAMRLLPGLSGMRVSARFGLFVTFALVAFAARGLDRAAARWSGRGSRVAFWSLLGAFALFELDPRDVNWFQILEASEFPPVYAWLAGRPEVVAIAEVPMTANPAETAYMYYSTAHWKPIANGFSGYDPPLHQELAGRLRGLPDRDDLDRLRQIGVTHLVIHTGKRRAHLTQAMVAAWERSESGEVKRVYADFRDSVYAIRPPALRNPNRAGW